MPQLCLNGHSCVIVWQQACSRVALNPGDQVSVKPHEAITANLGKKNSVYLARFRFGGKEYKRSLKTSDRKSAEAALHRIEDALHRLAIHLISVPPKVDPGDFIISGGVLTAPVAPPPSRPVRTPAQAVSEYLEALGHLASSNRATMRSHLRNLLRLLGAKAGRSVDQIELRDLEQFLQTRLRERCHTTVGKERHTVVQFFAWAVTQGYLATSPAVQLTKIKASGDRAPFRTVQEIEAILHRGCLDSVEALATWDCLYLAPAEITELLTIVQKRSVDEVSNLLHAIPAYTGMRRGEVLRLRWLDVELDQDAIVARSRKQSRQAVETRRRIDLHPELRSLLVEWQRKRPRGQFVICDESGAGPLTTLPDVSARVIVLMVTTDMSGEQPRHVVAELAVCAWARAPGRNGWASCRRPAGA